MEQHRFFTNNTGIYNKGNLTAVYNAGLYVRYSKDDGQIGDSSSIQTQKSMLEKFCEEQGFKVYDTYVDDGYSGTNFNRPDFQRLLSDIDDGKINLVITKDLSRLGRDYILTGYYTEIHFPERRVRYIALNDNVDTIRQDNDIAPFKNILNDMYARDMSRKIKSGKRQLMMKGYFICGQTPYGYKKDPNDHHKLIIDEEAAEIIREIYRLSMEGHGYVAVAKILAERKIMIPSEYKAKNGDTRFERFIEWQKQNGYRWCRRTVQYILHDRTYIGDMVNGKYHIPNYKTKKRVKSPVDRLVIVENTHEPIISREDFEIVQQLIKARHYPKKHKYDNPFKSIVFCAICGQRMYMACNNGKRAYLCSNHFRNPNQCKQNNQIAYATFERIVTERLRKLFAGLESNDDLLGEILNSADKPVKKEKLLAEKIKIEKRISILTKITKKLFEDYAANEIDDISYQTFLKEYQQEQKQLNERLAGLGKELNSENNQEVNLRKLKELTSKFIDFTELTPNMLHQLIERIEVGSPDKKPYERRFEINIVYRFIGTAI